MADGTVKGSLRRLAIPPGGESPDNSGADGELGPLVVSAPDGEEFPVADASLTLRYGGGKSVAVATVTSSGNTTILTPSSGKSLRLYWVSAINDPDEAATPLIKISLGAAEIYRVYALAHWEVFTGAADASLTVNLSDAASVAVTVHYEEIA